MIRFLLLFVFGGALSLRGQGLNVAEASVVTDTGERVRFLSDLVGNRTAVIDFIYTTCGGICPMQGQVYDRLSRALGARLGNDVVLISITIDPQNDTPERLAKWKARFSSATGWTCVTGDPATLRELAQSLLGKSVQGLAHDATAVIYRPSSKTRKSISSLVGPSDFIAAIDAAH